MERALAAVDELSGFVLACAHVRPEGLAGMRAKSVRKKLKQPSFAAAVSREDVARGAEDLGVELDELIEQVVSALAPLAGELGVGDRPAT
jgi:predicted hydrolase (HD superfamily)